jgi:Tfp pilus assembly protein PilN
MKRINLLPPGERDKASREQGLAYALLGLVVLVVALGAVYLMLNRQVATKQDRVNDLQAQIQQVDSQVQALKWAEVLQTQRTSMMTTAAQIYAARVDWSNILEELSLVIPDQVVLTDLTAQVPAKMQPTVGGASSSAASAGATQSTGADITLAGRADNHVSVAGFMTRLGLLPQLTNVQLVSSTESTSGNFVDYQITASLRPFSQQPPVAQPATTMTSAGGAQ